jgi:diacylglycerol kinase family enzyme
VLIVNPTAGGGRRVRQLDEARRIFRNAGIETELQNTTAAGEATIMARRAVGESRQLVIVCGGDGTVNEVVNGLLGPPREINHSAIPNRHLPAVGVVPGGSANVFARSLGISVDPVEATNQLVDLLGEHRGDRCWRRIGLMDCGERWAVFTAGMGVDGEVVGAIEAQRNKGRKVTSSRYIRAAVPVVLRGAHREPGLTLHLPGRDPVTGVHLVFVSNASPWTYANGRPVWTNPGTSFETGLGVFATTSMKVWANLGLVRQMLAKRPKLTAKHLIRDDNLRWLRVTCDHRPVASQIDGDYLGMRDAMTFTAVPDALGVVAPPAKSPPDLH